MTNFDENCNFLVKIDTSQLSKLYYTIGEVAELFSVNTSLIRFWEKEFPQLSPKKNQKGKRLYTIKDIENLNKIYHLVKEKGFTLEGAKNALKSKDKSDDSNLEISSNANQEPKEYNLQIEEIIYKLEKIKDKLKQLS